MATAAVGLASMAGGCALLMSSHVWVVVLGVLLFGAGLPVVIVGITTAIQRRTPGPLQGRARWDGTYTLLESLVRVLGQVREDHSSILFVSNNILRAPKDTRGIGQNRSLSLPKTRVFAPRYVWSKSK